MSCRSVDLRPRLPVRSAPAVGEAIQGYFLRLAEANGYKLSWLLRQAAIPLTYATVPFDAAEAAHALGGDAATIAAAAFWPVPNRRGLVSAAGHQLPATLILHAGKRICPACLAGNGISKQLWQLLPAVACLEHTSLLVDECPACHRRLDFRDVPLAGCRCGWRCRDEILPRASALAVELTAFFLRMARAEPARDGEAPVVGLEAAMRLAWFAAGPIEEKGWRALHMSKPSAAQIAALMEGAAPVLLQWPSGLHQWLADRRRNVEGRIGLQAEFGGWSARLENVLRIPGCEAVADEARNWLARDWGRRTLKPSSFLSGGASAEMPLTRKEAANRLGVSQATISNMIADGRLDADVREMGRRTMWRIQPGDVDRFEEESAAMLDARQASVAIGLSEEMIEQLGRAGVLRGEAVSFRGKRIIRYGHPTLDAFAARLAAVAIKADGPRDLIRLTDLPARRQVSTLTVLDRVLAGALRCFHLPTAEDRRILAAYAVSAEATLLSPGCEHGGVSFEEAAKALGVNQRMIPIFLARGCLSATSRRPGQQGMARRGISSASVQSFPATFVMTSEIARSRGTSTRAAISTLLAAGLQPVVVADSALGISAVWRREDVQAT